MTPALRWAAMRAIFNVSLIVRDKATRQHPQDHNFWRARKAEADSNRGPSAYQPKALPLGPWTSIYIYRSMARPTGTHRFSGINYFQCLSTIQVVTTLVGCYMVHGATWNCCRLGARFVYTTTLQCHLTGSHNYTSGEWAGFGLAIRR